MNTITNNPIIKQALDDTKALRDNAPKNGNIFFDDITVKLPCQPGSKREEIDDLIDELESDDEPLKVKKSSFFQNLMISWNQEKPCPCRCRFQQLAGIHEIKPKAKLIIGKQTFDLSENPQWYDVIRYKICGIKLEIPSKC